MKIVTLLSGGLDSTLVTTMAVNEVGHDNVYALSFGYGQKHGQPEIESAERIVHHLDIHWRYQRLDRTMFDGTKSALMDNDVDIPNVSYDDLVGVSPTYVPFRNGIFVSIATAHALNVGAEYVMIGAHAEDARNWAYPDCSPEFIGAMSAAVYIGSYRAVRLSAPLLTMTKAQIVQTSLDESSPIFLTRSCYTGDKVSCGVCPTCRSRLEAFAEVGGKDPIPYQD